MMIWIAMAVSGAVSSAIGAGAGFQWSIRQMNAAVQAMTASARSMDLSAQRLVAESALLKFGSLRQAMNVSDGVTYDLRDER